jgi:predicted  nucleic acid-binding Zn-ribbon protein
MADGSIEFKTDLDNSDLEKQLKDATRKVEALKKKIETETANRSAIEKEMDGAQAAIERTSAETEKLRARLEELRNVDPTDQGAWFAAQREVDGLTTRLAEAEKREASLAADKEKLDVKWQKATDKINGYNEQLGHAQNRQERLGEEMRAAAMESAPAWQRAGDSIRAKFSSVADGVRERMSAAASQAVAPWQAFAKRVGTMLRKVFVFSVILAGLRAIKNAIGSMLSKNEQFNSSVENLKATMRGFLGQMVQMVLPFLTGLVNTLAAVFQRIASFIDSIFGTNIIGNIKQQRDESTAEVRQRNAEKVAEYDKQVAQERERHAKELAAAQERQAKSARKLERAQKKANAQVMGFDELNKLAEESSEDAADALDDYAEAIEDPDYSSIEPPELESDWTQSLVPDAGLLQGLLDWLDMLRTRIETDVEGPFARIREGLGLIRQGWDEIVRGISTGDWGLVWQGICDIVIGTLYVIEGALDAFLDWLDEVTGGRFHTMFLGLEEVIGGFVKVAEGLLRGDFGLLVEGMGDILIGLWHVAIGAFEGIESVFSDFMGWLDEVTGKRFTAIFKGLADIVGGFCEFCIGLLTLDLPRAFDGLGKLFGGLASLVRGAFDVVLGVTDTIFAGLRAIVNGFFDFLGQQFPQFKEVIDAMRDGVLIALDFIQGVYHGFIDTVGSIAESVINGVGEVVRGVLEFVVGLFTLDGERIVGGLKMVVNGFATLIEGVVNSLLNAAIGAINGLISGINHIPGVSLPTIPTDVVRLPRLANGAVIPPNREFMAVLGDQRSGNNIEAPESLMRQVVREEAGQLIADAILAMGGAGTVGGDAGGDVTLVLQVDGETIARAVNRGNASLARRGELGSSVAFV